jgi:hypothetical protein
MQTKYENALSFIESSGWNDEKLRNEDTIIPFIAKMLEAYADGQQLKHGGKRIDAGRKSLFKEKTKGVKFMCPISKEADLKKYVNRKLLEWSKSGI